MDEKELERIDRMISEYRIITNKARRYWKKLVKEGLMKAKNEGIEVRVMHDEGIETFNPTGGEKSVMAYNMDSNLEDDEIVELVRPDYPSLYNKYIDAVDRHQKLRSTLDKIDYEDFESA